MSQEDEGSSDRPSPEERAEALMQRVTTDASRIVTRFVGRAREEIEDLVAEARSHNEHRGDPNRDQ